MHGTSLCILLMLDSTLQEMEKFVYSINCIICSICTVFII